MILLVCLGLVWFVRLGNRSPVVGLVAWAVLIIAVLSARG